MPDAVPAFHLDLAERDDVRNVPDRANELAFDPHDLANERTLNSLTGERRYDGGHRRTGDQIVGRIQRHADPRRRLLVSGASCFAFRNHSVCRPSKKKLPGQGQT